jgi:flagellar basal body-associated protein FliL
MDNLIILLIVLLVLLIVNVGLSSVCLYKLKSNEKYEDVLASLDQGSLGQTNNILDDLNSYDTSDTNLIDQNDSVRLADSQKEFQNVQMERPLY